MTTRGIAELKRLRIRHSVHPYRHDVKGAAFAAEATGIPIERMIKTLVVADPEGKRPRLVLMPGHLELDLKQAARLAGEKKLRMATVPEAEKWTGYQVGGISPFGARKNLPVLMDESLTAHDRVGINGGARGTIVSLSLEDLVADRKSVV